MPGQGDTSRTQDSTQGGEDMEVGLFELRHVFPLLRRLRHV